MGDRFPAGCEAVGSAPPHEYSISCWTYTSYRVQIWKKRP